MLAVLNIQGPSIVTPLGIRRNRDHLVVKLYPGTGIHELGYSVYEMCLAQPYNPLAYYAAVLEHSVELVPAKSIHTPCPRVEGPRIEAVVASRYMESSGILTLVLEPILVLGGKEWFTYSRSLGCSIELLIAFTRLRHWAKNRIIQPPCTRIRQLVYTVLSSYDCIMHSTWNSEVHRVAATVAKSAIDHAFLTGCVAPSNIEDV